jgi:DNA replication protein DnaC
MIAAAQARQALEHLGLVEAATVLEGRREAAAQKQLPYADFLADLLASETSVRRERYLRARTRLAHLPFQRTLDQFDFRFQPSIDKRQIKELATLTFVSEAANILFLGPPGVGKTHLAIALGVKAVEAGYSVLFLTLEALMGRLVRARHENRLDRILHQLVYPRVLILDELGYLPLTREEASLFFRLLVRRYERASLIVTSNKSFAHWGEVFNDQVLATAILDRLLHHATTVNIKGDSYRLREKKKAGLLGRRPKPVDAEETAAPA